MIRPRVRLWPRVRGRVKNTEKTSKNAVYGLSRPICVETNKAFLLAAVRSQVFVTEVHCTQAWRHQLIQTHDGGGHS